MADLHVTRRDDESDPDATLADGIAPAGRITEPDHLLEAHTHAGTPGTIAQVDDPELARMQIEHTRARMSETIDQIEDALVRKRAQVEEKLDVMAPVRRRVRDNAWPMLGGVFLGGLILGFLTGGDDDEDDDYDDDRPRKRRKGRKGGRARSAVSEFGMDQDREQVEAYGGYYQERAELWERRARRLMDVANQQEAELLVLRGQSEELEPAPRRGGYDGMPLDEADSYSAGPSGYGRYANDYAGSGILDADGLPIRAEDDLYSDGLPARGEDDLYGGRDPLPSPI
jgi:hypothetical protein